MWTQARCTAPWHMTRSIWPWGALSLAGDPRRFNRARRPWKIHVLPARLLSIWYFCKGACWNIVIRRAAEPSAAGSLARSRLSLANSSCSRIPASQMLHLSEHRYQRRGGVGPGSATLAQHHSGVESADEAASKAFIYLCLMGCGSV